MRRFAVALLLLIGACDAAPSAVAVTPPTPASATAEPAVLPPTATAGRPHSVGGAVAASAPSEPIAAAAGAHHCEGSPELCQANAAPPIARPVQGGELFGNTLDPNLSVTPLADLLARPAEFADKVVVTSGTIARVCQARGCWMELQTAGNPSIARVPMAGHAFFVPMDASGRSATVQGAVSVRAGTPNPLRIDATSVLIASRGAP